MVDEKITSRWPTLVAAAAPSHGTHPHRAHTSHAHHLHAPPWLHCTTHAAHAAHHQAVRCHGHIAHHGAALRDLRLFELNLETLALDLEPIHGHDCLLRGDGIVETHEPKALAQSSRLIFHDRCRHYLPVGRKGGLEVVIAPIGGAVIDEQVATRGPRAALL